MHKISTNEYLTEILSPLELLVVLVAGAIPLEGNTVGTTSTFGTVN